MLIELIESNGEQLAAPGTPFYGTSRPADIVPARSSAPVRVRFYADDGVTPKLLPDGTALYFDCKPPGKYDSASFALSLAITAAPADPAVGCYEGTLDTNKTEANALLSPNNADGTHPEATEPDFVALTAQLCWQSPGEVAPRRSEKWTITLDNCVRHGLEGAPTAATPALHTLTITPLATPAAPTVSIVGEEGSGDWSYAVTARLSDGSSTAIGSPGATSNGPAALTGSNHIQLDWSAVPGAAAYDIWLLAGPGDPVLGKVGTAAGTTFRHTGQIADGAAPPATNQTGTIQGDGSLLANLRPLCLWDAPSQRPALIAGDSEVRLAQGAVMGSADLSAGFDDAGFFGDGSRLTGLTGAPGAPAVPFATPFVDVVKRALPGLSGGEIVVITQEGNRVEQFVPTAPTLMVSGGSQNGAYALESYQSHGRNAYGLVGALSPGDQVILWSGARWEIINSLEAGTYYYSPSDVISPDYCAHWYHASDDSAAAVTVARHDAANNANWVVLQNTINLHVNPTGGSVIVNGITCQGASPTNVGWVDPAAILLSFPFGGVAANLAVLTDADGIMLASVTGGQGHLDARDTFAFGLPAVVSPRAQGLILRLAANPDASGG